MPTRLVAEGGLAEVTFGELAAGRASAAAVSDFARRMVDDHTAANETLAGIAEASEIPLPDALNAEHAWMRDRLEGLEGAAFDLEYMRGQVVDHQKTVQLLVYEIGQGQNGELQRFAAATLPTVLTGYVTAMAKATKKAPAFSVNAFTPDGILGTKLFNGLDLRGPSTSPLDLSTIGLTGAKYTVGDVTQALARARDAQRVLAKNGVPGLSIREGQHLGVFVDLHAERFGLLAST